MVLVSTLNKVNNNQMLRSSRRLPSALLTFSRYKYLFSTLKLPSFKPIKGSVWARLALGCGMLLSLGYVHMIEDEAIRNLKGIMSRQISLLKGEYGQTTTYP